MPAKFHGPEKHSLEPILVADKLNLDMNFKEWNSLVGEKMRQLGIAQHLGSAVLEHSDQEDIDMLFKVFPEHYATLASIMNHDSLLND